MVIIGLALLGICVFVYLAIEPFMELRKQKIEREKEVQRLKEEQLAEQKRFIIEKQKILVKAKEESIQRELLKQSLSKRDYQMYEQATVRGGHGNSKLMSWEYGWTKGDIDDKDNQGRLTKR